MKKHNFWKTHFQRDLLLWERVVYIVHRKGILHLDKERMRIKNKRNYNSSNESTEVISQEFDVQRWSSFLPPLHNFKVNRLQSLGVEFERLLKQNTD